MQQQPLDNGEQFRNIHRQIVKEMVPVSQVPVVF